MINQPAKKSVIAWLATPRGRAIALAGVVLVGLAAWLLLRPPAYAVQAAKTGEAVDVVYATGIMDHVREASVAPIVSQPIRRVFVEEGATVKPGQLLAQLEDGPAQATAAQLAATAATARLAADRAERLFKSGFGSQAARDEAVGQYQAADAAARSARAHLSDYAIKAPIAGRILRRDAEPGDLAVTSKVMFVIADDSSLRVTADLDERDIARVQAGQPALIRADAFPGKSFDASVKEITPQGDSTSRVFRVRLIPAPGSPLKAGMTVEANVIAAKRENAILVPASAVKDDFVWVVGEANKISQRKVTRGVTGGDLIEILSGLRAGETVVLEPGDALKDGQHIRIKTAKAVKDVQK